MSRKITNFHSYALKPRVTGGSNTHDDEDDDDRAPAPPKRAPVPPNTDHDFYSKSAHHEILDIKMEADEPPPQPVAATTCVTSAAAVPGEKNCNANSIKHPEEKVQNNAAVANEKKKKRKPSERDKYYKHKRRYDRRNERRIDALLNVFGQVIKEHYPNVDTSRLEAQSDQVSTEEDEDSTLSICSADSAESTYTAPSSLASDASGL